MKLLKEVLTVTSVSDKVAICIAIFTAIVSILNTCILVIAQ